MRVAWNLALTVQAPVQCFGAWGVVCLMGFSGVRDEGGVGLMRFRPTFLVTASESRVIN